MSLIIMNSQDQNPHRFWNNFTDPIKLPRNAKIACLGYSFLRQFRGQGVDVSITQIQKPINELTTPMMLFFNCLIQLLILKIVTIVKYSHLLRCTL